MTISFYPSKKGGERMYTLLIFLAVQVFIYLSKNEILISANEKVANFLKKPLVLFAGSCAVALFTSEIKQALIVLENSLHNGFNAPIGLQILVCFVCVCVGLLISKSSKALSFE